MTINFDIFSKILIYWVLFPYFKKLIYIKNKTFSSIYGNLLNNSNILFNLTSLSIVSQYHKEQYNKINQSNWTYSYKPLL